MPYKWIVDLAERVGIPTVLLFILLLGGYKLLKPITEVGIVFLKKQIVATTTQTEMMVRQTKLLEQMAIDTAATRTIVERDQSEKKLNYLIDIKKEIKALKLEIKTNQ